MSSIKVETKKHLDKLLGLPLCLSRRAADMLILHFGAIREVENSKHKEKKASVGDYALHIQCPWRLENSNVVITGRGDLYYSAETGDYFDIEQLDDNSFHKKGKSIQDRKMSDILQGIDPITGSYMNITDFLVVENIETDDFGGAVIYLSGDYRIRMFPASSKGEHWRLFQPTTNEKHFVVED